MSERTFLAAITNLNEQAHTADFYIMNTSRNRNDWGVTDKALEEAAPTLKGAPLGLGKDYKTGHYPDDQIMDVGKFSGYQKPGSYLTSTAKIEDLTAWSKMRKGELGPVSVVISVYNEVCSKCGESLVDMQDRWHDHECIKSGKAYSQIDSFKFHRVDFVDEPAYPQAGLMDMTASVTSFPLTLYASFYESQNKPSVKIKPKQTEEESPLTEEEKTKMADLEAANKKLETDLKASNDKATANETAVKELKAQLEKIQTETHSKLVAEVLEARTKAGIAGKPEDESKTLTALTAETLAILKTDAEKTAALLNTVESGPKTKYTAQAGDSLTEAIKKKRAELGFPLKEETKQ